MPLVEPSNGLPRVAARYAPILGWIRFVKKWREMGPHVRANRVGTEMLTKCGVRQQGQGESTKGYRADISHS